MKSNKPAVRLREGQLVRSALVFLMAHSSLRAPTPPLAFFKLNTTSLVRNQSFGGVR